MKNQSPIEIAVAHGDGIGPEIMKATLRCLHAVGAPLSIKEIEVGEKVYKQGEPTGITEQSWEVLYSTRAFLKAPITTPQGGGFKSLNVTIRAGLGLYANVRPSIAYYPYINTLYPDMDVVIVRENEEDLYTGIEYNLSDDTKAAIKLITEAGCERVIRYAFEYAIHNKRKKVSCFTKDNIMKLTDGLFHRVFEEIRLQYPSIESEHWIVDIGAAKLAASPHQFDVIVLPNLYGDILSDIAAQIAGSVGLAGSANIGSTSAMFEAIHGSAPRRAGQNIANPSGLLLASIMMLQHLELNKEAELLHNAWLRTLEEGINTYDIYQEAPNRKKVGTDEFTNAIIERIGKKPNYLPTVTYERSSTPLLTHHLKPREKNSSPCYKAELYIALAKTSPQEIFSQIQLCEKAILSSELKLSHVFSRGTPIWPGKQFNHPISGNILRVEIEGEKPNSLSYSEFKATVAKLHTQFLQIGVDVRALFYF